MQWVISYLKPLDVKAKQRGKQLQFPRLNHQKNILFQ